MGARVERRSAKRFEVPQLAAAFNCGCAASKAQAKLHTPKPDTCASIFDALYSCSNATTAKGVLVIKLFEDDPSGLKGMRRILSLEYEVLSASDPRQALEIDLVISDMTMPEMSGAALLREIAQISPATAG